MGSLPRGQVSLADVAADRGTVKVAVFTVSIAFVFVEGNTGSLTDGAALVAGDFGFGINPVTVPLVIDGRGCSCAIDIHCPLFRLHIAI